MSHKKNQSATDGGSVQTLCRFLQVGSVREAHRMTALQLHRWVCWGVGFGVGEKVPGFGICGDFWWGFGRKIRGEVFHPLYIPWVYMV